MEIFERYRQHVTDTKAKLAVVQRSIQGNALLRLMTIILGGIGLFMAVQTEHVWLVMVVFFAVLVFFMGLVWRQSKLERSRSALEDFLAVNQNEIDILEGKANRYPDGAIFRNNRHPYSGDLDVFGPASLFLLVNRSATSQANRLLADWFSAPADAETIAERQRTVGELATDIDWCQQFQAALWFNLRHSTDVRRQFALFLDSPFADFGKTYVRWYVAAAPWLMAVIGSVSVFFPAFFPVLVLFGMAHFFATMIFGGRISRISEHVSKAGRLLDAFATSFALIENRQGLTQPVSAKLKRLAVLIDRLDYRLNMLVGAVLNMVALWDFRQVFAISDWRKQHGGDVLNAFDVAAECEVLVSLATLSRNHPQWVFPEVVGHAKPFVNAQSLSHPLIPSGTAVANDYHMENHRVALITGSNMAGKSTFLRTIGINAVLAFSGAPICGKRMQLSVFHLVTYMRIADSLNESTSTFKAELDRIQMVLETVKGQSDVFFLVDEMLRGTNSVDKYLGSKAIIEQLIAYGGAGMIATHDLQLAKLASTYPSILANYHFDIQVADGEMLFDYKLKVGECKVFNASLLLKEIGIEVAN